MTRGAWLLVFVTVVSACGGSAEPARAPESSAESREAEQTEAHEAEQAEEASAEAAPPAGDEAPAAQAPSQTEVSTEDRKTILQLLVDDLELGKFLKTNAPGRLPLKISGTEVPDGVTKDGRAVQVVDAPKSEKDPVLVITKFEVDGKTATVSYRYDVEGIRGSTRISRGDSGWELKSSRIVER